MSRTLVLTILCALLSGPSAASAAGTGFARLGARVRQVKAATSRWWSGLSSVQKIRSGLELRNTGVAHAKPSKEATKTALVSGYRALLLGAAGLPEAEKAIGKKYGQTAREQAGIALHEELAYQRAAALGDAKIAAGAASLIPELAVKGFRAGAKKTRAFGVEAVQVTTEAAQQGHSWAKRSWVKARSSRPLVIAATVGRGLRAALREAADPQGKLIERLNSYALSQGLAASPGIEVYLQRTAESGTVGRYGSKPKRSVRPKGGLASPIAPTFEQGVATSGQGQTVVLDATAISAAPVAVSPTVRQPLTRKEQAAARKQAVKAKKIAKREERQAAKAARKAEQSAPNKSYYEVFQKGGKKRRSRRR